MTLGSLLVVYACSLIAPLHRWCRSHMVWAYHMNLRNINVWVWILVQPQLHSVGIQYFQQLSDCLLGHHMASLNAFQMHHVSVKHTILVQKCCNVLQIRMGFPSEHQDLRCLCKVNKLITMPSMLLKAMSISQCLKPRPKLNWINLRCDIVALKSNSKIVEMRAFEVDSEKQTKRIFLHDNCMLLV